MSKLIKIIKRDLLAGKNIALIGPSESGKSWFIINKVIPELNDPKPLNIDYLKDCNQELSTEVDISIRIVDEFETFIDRERLERCHPEENPYYTDKYTQEVNDWHSVISQIKEPTLFVITRNDNQDINHLAKNLNKLDWGARVKGYKFLASESKM